ncbi:AI-2E family transporter [Pseudoflavonifractor sp. MSJ-37]|uniref:AI-2E family transporter n=1 Tax=Pseudoflavonifractor sp. MSJ-37 TaxID=2841531 RepID=UPI001C0FAD35|nr:AI-2E family transporter [Pseudoflavonifractor sp. MSJ-37]MBU5434189.1 AI-2E family transporter [Pseudoflavonifractor sp. MSJ-37]
MEGEDIVDKKLVRSILLIVTYTVLLVLALLRFEELRGLFARLMGLLRPVYIGFAVAFVLDRPCRCFYKLYQRILGGGPAGRASRPLAVATSYLALLAALAVLVSFVLPKVGESVQLFVSQLGGYLYALRDMAQSLMSCLHLDTDALYAGLPSVSELTRYLRDAVDGLFQGLSSTLMGVVNFTSALISVAVTGLLSLIFSIYMLGGRDTLLPQCRRVLLAYVPRKWAEPILGVVRLTAATFTNYVSGQLIEACILGALCAAGTLFIQADYAPLIGVIVGASALVPVAGAYIGAALGAFLLLMVSPLKALIFLVFLGILQQIEGNVIYPRVVGTSIGLPGIWVLAAVTVGGGLFGLPGILLSVPTASVLYALLRKDVRRRTAEREAR